MAGNLVRLLVFTGERPKKVSLLPELCLRADEWRVDRLFDPLYFMSRYSQRIRAAIKNHISSRNKRTP